MTMSWPTTFLGEEASGGRRVVLPSNRKKARSSFPGTPRHRHLESVHISQKREVVLVSKVFQLRK
ncbi:hypothetical protein SESBI_47488 [Sesbania bispinosa]|nr:hypothetical protein SESBI_47488 [Sesbania bispinosa]